MRSPDVPVAPLPPLREYQKGLLEASVKQDSIVYLETGLGKTRIAVERIASQLASLRQNGQVAVFLAPSVPLVRQQAEVLASVPAPEPSSAPGSPSREPDPDENRAIEADGGLKSDDGDEPVSPNRRRGASDANGADTNCNNTNGVKNGKTGAIIPGSGDGRQRSRPTRSRAGLLRVHFLGGSFSHDCWRMERWTALIGRCDVLVCTPAVLLSALVRAMLKASQIGMLVLDEAHHCREQHPYAVLMREFIARQRPRPAIPPPSAEADKEVPSPPLPPSTDPSTVVAISEAPNEAAAAAGGSGDGSGGGGGGSGSPGSNGAARPGVVGSGATRAGASSESLRPRLLGLTASPLEPLSLQDAFCGGRLVTPAGNPQALASCPSRPKAQVIWVGPGAPLPPPPSPHGGPITPAAAAAQPDQVAEALLLPQDAPAYSRLLEQMAFCRSLLVLSERVAVTRDRLRRLVQLGEITWERVGLAGEGAPASAWVAQLLAAGHERDGYDISLRDVKLLKAQVSALESALTQLGPWPALALAAADLFASASPATSAAAADQGSGAADPEGALAGGEVLVGVQEPTDLGPPPGPEVGRQLMSDMGELAGALERVGLPAQLLGPAGQLLSLGERLAAAVLMLVMEGFLGLLAQPGGAEAEKVAQGFGVALLSRGGMRPNARGVLSPWAARLLAAIPSEELQRQVLGIEAPPASPPTPSASGAPEPSSDSSSPFICPVPLVSRRVTWLLRQLHIRAAAAAAAKDSDGGDGGRPWAAMVFCERKATCEALLRLISMLPTLEGLLNAAVFVGTSGWAAAASRGRRHVSGHRRQELVRQDFSAGRLNLLLSTSVGAEGLDFSHCALVAALDLPKHVTPFVQSGGRARAPGAEHWLLVSSLEEEMAAAKLLEAEQRMLAEAQSVAAANYLAIVGGKQDIMEVDGAGPSSGPAAQGEGSAGTVSEPQTDNIYQEWDIDLPSEDALEVPSTGARLPAVWAVDMLQQLCSQLPGNDGSTVLQPLFRWDPSGPDHARSFTYTVILPANLGLPAVVGPPCSSKEAAKKLASLEAVRRLWQRGDLDDHLVLKHNRRAATRAAHAKAFGGFTYSIPKATLTHRLPRLLSPAAQNPGPSAPTAANANNLTTDPANTPTEVPTIGTCADASVRDPTAPDDPPAPAAAAGAHAGTASDSTATDGGPVKTFHLYCFVLQPKDLAGRGCGAGSGTGGGGASTVLSSLGTLSWPLACEGSSDDIDGARRTPAAAAGAGASSLSLPPAPRLRLLTEDSRDRASGGAVAMDEQEQQQQQRREDEVTAGSESTTASAGAGAGGDAGEPPATAPVLCWGVLLHGKLPVELPPFDLYLPDTGKAELPCTTHVVYLGPLCVGPRLRALVNALGRVLGGLTAWPCAAAVARAAAAAAATAAGTALVQPRVTTEYQTLWERVVGFEGLGAAVRELQRTEGGGGGAAGSCQREGSSGSGGTTGSGGSSGGGDAWQGDVAGGPDSCWWTPLPLTPPCATNSGSSHPLLVAAQRHAAGAAATLSYIDWDAILELAAPPGRLADRPLPVMPCGSRQPDAEMEEVAEAGRRACKAKPPSEDGSPAGSEASVPAPRVDNSWDAYMALVRQRALVLSLNSYRLCGIKQNPADAAATGHNGNGAEKEDILLQELASYGRGRQDWLHSLRQGARGGGGETGRGGVGQDARATTAAGNAESSQHRGAGGAVWERSSCAKRIALTAKAEPEPRPEAVVPQPAEAEPKVANVDGATEEGEVVAEVAVQGIVSPDGEIPSPAARDGVEVDKVEVAGVAKRLKACRLDSGGVPLCSPASSPSSPTPATAAAGESASSDGQSATYPGAASSKRGRHIDRIRCMNSKATAAFDDIVPSKNSPTAATPDATSGPSTPAATNSIRPDTSPPAPASKPDVNTTEAPAPAPAASPAAGTSVLGKRSRDITTQQNYREMMSMDPKHIALYPISAGAWRQLHGLPAVMWRLEGLATAAELLEGTLRPAGWAPPDSSGDVRGGGRSADVVLVAMATTCPAARDPWFNNDRFEYLGDAVLKLLAHLYLFLRERHEPGSHEGVLSFMRDSYVANEVLAAYALDAKGLGLTSVLRALPFDPRRAVRQARFAPDEADDGTMLRREQPPPFFGFGKVEKRQASVAQGQDGSGGGEEAAMEKKEHSLVGAESSREERGAARSPSNGSAGRLGKVGKDEGPRPQHVRTASSGEVERMGMPVTAVVGEALPRDAKHEVAEVVEAVQQGDGMAVAATQKPSHGMEAGSSRRHLEGEADAMDMEMAGNQASQAAICGGVDEAAALRVSTSEPAAASGVALDATEVTAEGATHAGGEAMSDVPAVQASTAEADVEAGAMFGELLGAAVPTEVEVAMAPVAAERTVEAVKGEIAAKNTAGGAKVAATVPEAAGAPQPHTGNKQGGKLQRTPKHAERVANKQSPNKQSLNKQQQRQKDEQRANKDAAASRAGGRAGGGGKGGAGASAGVAGGGAPAGLRSRPPRKKPVLATRVHTGVNGKRLADGVEALIGAHLLPAVEAATTAGEAVRTSAVIAGDGRTPCPASAAGGGAAPGSVEQQAGVQLPSKRMTLTCSPAVQIAVDCALHFCVGAGLLPADTQEVIFQGLLAFAKPPPLRPAQLPLAPSAAVQPAPQPSVSSAAAVMTDITTVAVEVEMPEAMEPAVGNSTSTAAGLNASSQQQRQGNVSPPQPVNEPQPQARGPAGRPGLAAGPVTAQKPPFVLAVEKILGYRFSNHDLCVQALTHVSHPNAVHYGGGYQRIEFLGDAVLGMVVSFWAFREGGSAEAMTERRSELVSNGPLAAAAVRRGLHRFLRAGSSSLQATVNQFAAAYMAALKECGPGGKVVVTTSERVAKNNKAEKRQRRQAATARAAKQELEDGEADVEKDDGGLEEGEIEAAECDEAASREGGSKGVREGRPGSQSLPLRAPKALADILEALVGAVYLDSGADLECCERAVAAMMLD